MAGQRDPWAELSRLTPARIALGRTGRSLPTTEVLTFAMAHARARDAVHANLDAASLTADLGDLGWPIVVVSSCASDREVYLRRPDLGRRIDDTSRDQLKAHHSAWDLAIVVADGLSATAVHHQVAPLLRAFRPHIDRLGLTVAPLVLASQARVAIGDDIAQTLGARIVAVLIGERPGLSSPDSLGVYLTYDPEPTTTDAGRNCLSNIRPAGLPHEAAAAKLGWLIAAARSRRLSGVALKDESDTIEVVTAPGQLPPI
jgi:ethanolamine ammonia-lyase small subunit